jgi:hypothetical protein
MSQFNLPNVYYFQQKKYLPVKNFVSQSLRTPLLNRFIDIHTAGKGLKDEQCPLNTSAFSHNPLNHSLLLRMLPQMEQYTGLALSPTYAYLRVYGKGEELSYHTDRPACEVSATITLGCSSSYRWPIHIENPEDKSDIRTIHLDPGDGMIYRGCEVPHWREEFIPQEEDDWQCQIFLHYVNKFGPFSNFKYDGYDKFFVESYGPVSNEYKKLVSRFNVEEVVYNAPDSSI